ncbi:hypothetical protein ABZ445_40640 [Streptomyces chartreusis]|uniref:hypothetical protein n=1 Tax=Streptomyces chartreusis TaxID=1969 RepID=UPI0033D156FA
MEELEDVTAQLDEEKNKVPQELKPTVEQLTSTLKEISNPKESPKQRQEVLGIIDEVTSTLEITSDSKTPPELREQLIVIVKQVNSTLEVSQDPQLPPEEQHKIALIVKHATSVLGIICNPKTPRELREQLIFIVQQVTSALEKSHDPKASTELQKQVVPIAHLVGVSLEIIHSAKTPPKERKKLAKTTHRVSGLLEQVSDPGTSPAQRAETQKVLAKETVQMQTQQEEAASSQGLPDVPLGEAAKVCTDAIFVAARDAAISKSLGKLLPKGWREVGVKEFWRVSHVGKDYLDLLVWLKDGNYADAPFETGRLITRLASLVPASRLFGLIGTPALYCLQAAWYLDQQLGIKAGTWLKMALEKKSGH